MDKHILQERRDQEKLDAIEAFEFSEERENEILLARLALRSAEKLREVA